MNEADTGEKAIGYEKFLSQSARKKTSEGLAALSASHKENILNSDGGLNELGSNSLEASTRKSISEQKGRYLNANNKDTVNDITAEGVKRTYYGALEETGSPEEALKRAIEFAKFFQATDEKGKKKGEIKINPETGELNKELYEPVLGGGYLSKLGEAEGNNMTDKMGRSVINGMAYNLAKGQVSAKKDNSVTTNNAVENKTGNSTEVAHTQPEVLEAIERAKDENGNVNWQKAASWINSMKSAEWNMSWKKQVAAKAADAGMYLAEDENGNISFQNHEPGQISGALMTGDVVKGGAAALETLTAKLNKEFVPKTAEDLKNYTDNGDGTFTSKSGETVKLDKKGRVTDLNGDIQTKYNPKAKHGVVSKTWGRAVGLVEKLRPESSASNSFNNGSSQPKNETSYSDNADTDEPVKDNVTNHDDTPSGKNNNTIITENAEKLNQNNLKNLGINTKGFRT